MRTIKMWDPNGFEDCYKHYPTTPFLKPSANISAEFCEAWNRDSRIPFFSSSPSRRPICVLIRGLFGKWMSGHFQGAIKACQDLGWQPLLINMDSSSSVKDGALRIEKAVEHLSEPAYFFAHSKGGLDLLYALKTSSSLRAKVAGLTLVQCPRGSSAVVDQMLLGEHRQELNLKERLALATSSWLLRMTKLDRGCLELSKQNLLDLIPKIDSQALGFPFISVASWSLEPTAWLDSFHERLNVIRPGVAHDGQFYLDQQIWSTAEQVYLPRLDHAQVVVGGGGFDCERFWRSIIRLMERRASRRPSQLN